jgi:hypothetical protein
MRFRNDDSFELSYLILTHTRKLVKIILKIKKNLKKILSMQIMIFPDIFLCDDSETN